jgi:hypothetical protein
MNAAIKQALDEVEKAEKLHSQIILEYHQVKASLATRGLKQAWGKRMREAYEAKQAEIAKLAEVCEKEYPTLFEYYKDHVTRWMTYAD